MIDPIRDRRKVFTFEFEVPKTFLSLDLTRLSIVDPNDPETLY